MWYPVNIVPPLPLHIGLPNFWHPCRWKQSRHWRWAFPSVYVVLTLPGNILDWFFLLCLSIFCHFIYLFIWQFAHSQNRDVQVGMTIMPSEVYFLLGPEMHEKLFNFSVCPIFRADALDRSAVKPFTKFLPNRTLLKSNQVNNRRPPSSHNQRKGFVFEGACTLAAATLAPCPPPPWRARARPGTRWPTGVAQRPPAPVAVRRAFFAGPLPVQADGGHTDLDAPRPRVLANPNPVLTSTQGSI